MINKTILFSSCMFGLLGLLCGQPLANRQLSVSPKSVKRRVTVKDAIQMTRWTDRGYFFGGTPDGPVGLFSPDKTQFAVVVQKGDIELNTVKYTVLLYETNAAFNSPSPRPIITMSSSSNRDAIANLKWLNNGTLVFLGENPGESAQVYRFDITTNKLTRMTNHSTSIVAFDISSDGTEIVFEATTRRVWNTEEIRRNGILITTQTPAELCSEQNADSDRRELFLQKGTGAPIEIKSPNFFTEWFPLKLSPNGKYALVGVHVAVVPDSWAEYKDQILHTFAIEKRKQGTWSAFEQYMILDTNTYKFTPLVDAPMNWSQAAYAWPEDGNSVVVSGTYLPLNIEDLRERATRQKSAFVAEIEIPSGRITKITDKPARIASLDNRTGELFLQPNVYQETLPLEAYKKDGSVWISVPTTTEGEDQRSEPFDVLLEEDVNTPPRIFVQDRKSNRKILLLDLNPQFEGLQFGRVEPVTWKATDGHEVMGGLYFPPDYVPGKRYPLVIQTHAFRKDRFWIDGPWSSAFAAQPLAAHDIVVLQVGSSVDPAEDARYSETIQEAPRQMAAYEGAIDYLNGRGLIDPQHVGVIGFSRTVFYVEYTLTHSHYPLRAASLADGFDGGYVNYLLWPIADYVAVNGGMPFGSSLAAWLKNSPGFNLDKVHSAVRLEYYGRGYALAGWQWFSGLSLLDKPVDFIWLPDGSHLLVKPWERLVSQQGNVDWFVFWLTGNEDPDPLKREQYQRWESLLMLQH